MSLLKMLAVLPILAMLAGCMIDDLKSDVRALKVYLVNTQDPDACKKPGQNDSSKECLYKLKITGNSGSANGIYRARIHPDVYKANAENCKFLNDHLLPQYASLKYDCPRLDGTVDFSKNSYFYPDTEAEYTFHVDGNPIFTVGDDAEFLSIPGTTHLRKK